MIFLNFVYVFSFVRSKYYVRNVFYLPHEIATIYYMLDIGWPAVIIFVG